MTRGPTLPWCECKSLAKFSFIVTVPTREGSLTDSITAFLVSTDYNLSIAIHIRMQFGRYVRSLEAIIFLPLEKWIIFIQLCPVIYFRWSTRRRGGEKGKENQDGCRLYDRIDFLCFDILAGLIRLIHAIHASNSIQEGRRVTETSLLLQSGVSTPTKTTLINP